MRIRTMAAGAIMVASALAPNPAGAQPESRAYAGVLLGSHHESSDFTGAGDAMTVGLFGGLQINNGVRPSLRVLWSF